MIVTFPAPSPAPLSAQTRFLRGLAAARVGFARDFLAYGRMQAPPALACETLDIDHGLSEGGWFRKIRFPSKNTRPRNPIPITKPAGADDPDSKELSVENWAAGLLATPFAIPHNQFLKVPSLLCQPYTLDNCRLGILLVNLSPRAQSKIRLPVDPPSYGLPRGTYALSKEGVSDRESLGQFLDRRELDLILAPGDIVIVTATPAASTGP